MNGRVHNPATAMFFSPDPFVQSPGNWSNYNRYSYVSNNPTKFTDPSGYIQCNIAMPWFDPGWVRIMNAYGGGGGGGRNAAFAAWDAQHMGSISYNWGNNRYEYANGNEASTSSALNQLYDRTRPEDKQNYAGSTLGYDHLYTITLGGQLRLAGSIGGEITGISNGFFVNSNANTIAGVLAANGEATAWGGSGNGNSLNSWDYFSNAASVASAYPTINGTWSFYQKGSDIRWTGKNGNYYKLAQLRNNGGYVKSMNIAKNASRLTRGIGNGFTIFSIVTSIGSLGTNLYYHTDNTSTWVGAFIGIGTGLVTLAAAPAFVTGAAILGTAWGISQLVAGDKINELIDNNFGYR